MSTPIPENQAPFTQAEILAVTQGWLRRSLTAPVVGVTTDSRGSVEGKLFVALRGDRYDGHGFVPDVLRRGAAAVLVEAEVSVGDRGGVIQVGSTQAALLALGGAHRARWGGRLVAVGGSAGKTTTRSAIQALLGHLAEGRVHATRGNLNNQIGVPMTLLGLLPGHDWAVVELGTNAPGEMTILTRICQPDIGVLTCIGLEHTEGLVDLDGVEREEGELFRGLRADGWGVGPIGDSGVGRLLGQLGASRRRTYGPDPRASYFIRARTTDARGIQRIELCRHPDGGGGELVLETSLLGLPGALAASAALAVAELGKGPLNSDDLVGALCDPELGEVGRLRRFVRGDGLIVLDDSYNANPASMTSSIAVARELARDLGRPLVLVLGEMRELGSLSEEQHARLASDVEGAQRLIAVGPATRPLVDCTTRNGVRTDWFEDAVSALEGTSRLIGADAVVLVKGSRGTRMERIVRALLGPGVAT